MISENKEMSINSINTIPNIKTNIDLSRYTTWKIGGKARYFWEPELILLPEIISFCYSNNIKIYFLGRGSNVLVDDEGLNGLVICTKKVLQNIKKDEDMVVAEAGVPMPALSKFVAKAGYSGYEFLIGIPGTIGAGVAINAGLLAKKIKEMKDLIIDVEIIDEKGEVRLLKKNQIEFDHRNSSILKNKWFVSKARFKLENEASTEEIIETTLNHLNERKNKQPLTKATAGSTFKNPIGEKSAGWYIENSGLKGFQYGGAQISLKHANWIENVKNASSNDILHIINHIITTVQKNFNVTLEPEITYFK
jgi:UDP-N-acetylmuramate dehydrogenase